MKQRMEDVMEIESLQSKLRKATVKADRLERINAALLEVCQELLKHPDGDDPLGGDLGHLERAIELARAAIALAQEPKP